MQLKFYHFNKCAGTSILHLLHNRVAESEFLHVEWLNRTAGLAETFDKKILHVTETAPAVETPWRQFAIGVFREPMARAFSDYKMVTRWDQELTTPQLKEIHRAALSGIIPFFSGPAAIAIGHYNHVTRTLAGPAFFDWFREVSVTTKRLSEAPTDKLLETALSVLERLDVVLTLDDLSPISTMATALSTEKLPIQFNQRLNAFGTSKSLDALTAEERQAISVLNKLDTIVWERVQHIGATNRNERAIDRFVSENDTTILDFSQSLPVANVWPRESNKGKHSVWTGNGGLTELYFVRRSHSRKYFNFLATGVLDSEQFENMKILVNGAPVNWTHYDTGAGFLVTAKIEADLIAAKDLITLAIEVPLVPSPGLEDARELGIEICKASLIADWEGRTDTVSAPATETKRSFFGRLGLRFNG